MGLVSDIEELKKILGSESAKEKKFKFPFGKKVGKGQAKKNYVTVLIVYENSKYEFKKYQIINQTIFHNLVPRLATRGHVLTNSKGQPLLILPEWSVEPFSPIQHFQDSLTDGSNKKGYQILMDRMINKVEEKKKMAAWIKWMIGIIVVAGIIFALVSGGGGK